MRYLFSIITSIVLLIPGQSLAQSRCSVSTKNSLSYYQTYLIPSHTIIKFDPNSIPIGGKIITMESLAYYSNARDGKVNAGNFSCTPSVSSSYINITMPFNFVQDGVIYYATSAPGISMSIHFRNQFSPVFGEPWYYNFPQISNGALPQHEFKITFIKSAEIKKKGIVSGVFAQEYIGNSSEYSSAISFGPYTISFVPTASTCSYRSQTVPLPAASSIIFNAIGKTSSSYRFDIALKCSNANSSKAIDVNIKLLDALNQGNSTTVLTTDSSASSGNAPAAKGVGIQVLKDGSPLTLGSTWKAITLAPRQAQGTVVQVPLEARYIQTDTTVTPGSVLARATVTLSYQ